MPDQRLDLHGHAVGRIGQSSLLAGGLHRSASEFGNAACSSRNTAVKRDLHADHVTGPAPQGLAGTKPAGMLDQRAAAE